MKQITKKIITLLFALNFFSTVYAANGQPFQELQNQINALQTQIDELQQSAGGPVEVTIDCSEDSITNALITHQNSPGTLTINIEGTCVENVLINRNNVALRGPGTIKAATSEVPALNVLGFNGISVDNLNIFSAIHPSLPSEFIIGGTGIDIRSNTAAEITAVNVSGFDLGIAVTDSSVLRLFSSTVSGNDLGILSARGGVARLSNVQVTNSGLNMDVRDQGRIFFGGENISSTISGGVEGIRIRRGGFARLTNGIVNITDNTRGIRIRGFGILDGGADVTISNNTFGIDCQNPHTISIETLVEPNAFLDNATVIDNSGFDVDFQCFPEFPE